MRNERVSALRSPFLNGSRPQIALNLILEHPADLAAALQEIGLQQAWPILKDATRSRQADIFGYLDVAFQAKLAVIIPSADLAAIIMEMNADDRADLYKKLSDEQRDALMPALAHAEREDIRQLTSYEEGTAGAIMTSDYACLSPQLSTTQAIEVLRREAPNKETIYRAYVVDAERHLIGSIRLQDLITAPSGVKVTDIIEPNTHAIRVDDDVEDAARKIARYDVIALPVIDAQGRLIGIITHDDALEVMEAEATKDFQRIGTVTNLDSSVATATVAMLYRARIAWLMLLVFGNIFSCAGIAHFEDTIAAHLALMFFSTDSDSFWRRCGIAVRHPNSTGTGNGRYPHLRLGPCSRSRTGGCHSSRLQHGGSHSCHRRVSRRPRARNRDCLVDGGYRYRGEHDRHATSLYPQPLPYGSVDG